MSRKRCQKGFTLLEVMVALTIFGLVTGGMSPVIISYLRRNTASEVRMGAIASAQFVLDEIRLIDPTTLPTSGSDSAIDVVVNERTYQVIASYCVEASFCSSVNNRHIQVEVNYLGKKIFSTQTVYTQLR